MFSLIRIIDIVVTTADKTSSVPDSPYMDSIKVTAVVLFILFPLVLITGFIVVSAFRYLNILDHILLRVFRILVSFEYLSESWSMRRLGYRTGFSGFRRIIQDGDFLYEIHVWQNCEWRSWTAELCLSHVNDFNASERLQMASCRMKTSSPYEVAVFYESELLQKDIDEFCSHHSIRPPDSLVLVSSRTPRLNDEIVRGARKLIYEKYSGSGV